MRVWTRLTIGFAATAMAIVGLYGAYQLRDEAADLRSAAERDLRLTAAAVQVAVGNALRDRQVDDVRAVLDAVTRRDPSLDLVVLDGSGSLIAGSWRDHSAEGVARRVVREAQALNRSLVRFEGPRGLDYLCGVFPVRADEGLGGTLVVVRPLNELRRDLAAETRSTVLSLATLVIGLGIAGWIVASIYVRVPLHELVQAMRAVRAGDLSARASFTRADELGAAASEFNAMTGELVEARRRLIAETEAREAMETTLQRADKLIAVGQLSARLAHEIGSPLQIVNGRARAIATRADIGADVRRSAEVLARESDRIARIVEQLLTFSRQTVPAFTSTQLSPPVRDIVELLAPEAERHGVRLELHAAEPLPAVNVDIGQVQQVAMNLLSNALRATASGGRVTVRLTASSFVRPGGQSQSSLSLIVEDTGHGVPEELIPRIFEPFFTTRLHSGGTGLGLAVVKSIVDAHGGAISVSTQMGRGTRFTTHFPAASEATADGWVA